MSRPDEFHDWPTLLNDLLAGRDLSAAFAGQAMTAILSGDATEAQIAGFLVALRAKGVTSDELSGLLAAALEAAHEQGWRWNKNINGEQVMQAVDSNSLSKALKTAGRNGYGQEFIYLADFLQGNTITIK